MQYIYFVHVMKVTVLANCISKTVERHLFVFTIFTVYSLRHHLTLPLVKCHTKRFQNSSIPYAIRTWHVASQAVAYSMWPWPPPPRKVRKHFLTRYTVKNGISNLYILLKSVLKMQEMPFQRPKFQNGISNLYILLKSALKMQEMPFQRPKFQKIFGGGMPPDPPTIVSSLWPPLH